MKASSISEHHGLLEAAAERCFRDWCFIPFDRNIPRFFGFAEFLAGLALIVLAWTIADHRYRFRVRTAPIPLQGITFTTVAVVGFLSLLTDLWRAQQGFVPVDSPIDAAEWQALLAGVLLGSFLLWAWFAFIKPPKFGEWNSLRYARALYHATLRGIPNELAEIADELARSAANLVKHAKNYEPDYREKKENQKNWDDRSETTALADDILSLIGDKRFCRAVVESSPITALAIFDEIRKAKKYYVDIDAFGQNVIKAALQNKDSFLYHESDGYTSGLIGHIKPVSQAMFGTYSMTEAIGSLLDVEIWKGQWTADQWEAYCRIVFMTFEAKLEQEFWNHSFVLHRAFGYLEHAANDLHKLNGDSELAWERDAYARTRVLIKFIEDCIKALDKKGVPAHLKRRNRGDHAVPTPYDMLADLAFETIFHASYVREPFDVCWSIQHNLVWDGIFNYSLSELPAAKIVQFKLCRLIYDDIKRMETFPNFKGAKLLGLCLNVMRFKVRDEGYLRSFRPLHKFVLNWTRKHFAWVHEQNPKIAAACLVDHMSYDQANSRLAKMYPAGLQKEPEYEYFQIDPLVQPAPNKPKTDA